MNFIWNASNQWFALFTDRSPAKISLFKVSNRESEKYIQSMLTKKTIKKSKTIQWFCNENKNTQKHPNNPKQKHVQHLLLPHIQGNFSFNLLSASVPLI